MSTPNDPRNTAVTPPMNQPEAEVKGHLPKFGHTPCSESPSWTSRAAVTAAPAVEKVTWAASPMTL